jgi:hypothetical protein
MPSAHSATKCGPPDLRRIISTRAIQTKSLPEGVEIFDRVWLKNPTSTELIFYVREKGAAARTKYRETLGAVPTTNDELPTTKLVNGERYEFHYPLSPQGWVPQDYPAGLIESKAPIAPPAIEEKLFSEKLKIYTAKVSIPAYYGKKRTTIELVYEFTKNPKYGWIDPTCPSPTPSSTSVR